MNSPVLLLKMKVSFCRFCKIVQTAPADMHLTVDAADLLLNTNKLLYT